MKHSACRICACNEAKLCWPGCSFTGLSDFCETCHELIEAIRHHLRGYPSPLERLIYHLADVYGEPRIRATVGDLLVHQDICKQDGALVLQGTKDRILASAELAQELSRRGDAGWRQKLEALRSGLLELADDLERVERAEKDAVAKEPAEPDPTDEQARADRIQRFRERVSVALSEMAESAASVEKSLNHPRAKAAFSDELRCRVAVWVAVGREVAVQAKREAQQGANEAGKGDPA